MKSQFLYDEHGRQLGLNWDALRPKAPAGASPAPAPSPVADTKTLEKLSRKRGPVSAASLANLSAMASKRYDYQQIADLWSQGKTNKEIMAEVGCGQSTVLLALKTVKPEGYDGKSGPRPLERCKEGHDLAVHGKMQKKGGRACQECKRRRDREAWQRRKERLKT